MDSLHGVEANGKVAGVFDIDNEFALAVRRRLAYGTE
jgi:hypothetical protein